MAIDFYEAAISRKTADERSGRNASAILTYVAITDAGEEESAVRAIAKALTPSAYQNLIKQSVDTTQLGPRIYKCDVRYGFQDDQRSLDAKETGESTYSFSTRGTTKHVTQSFSTTSFAAPGKTAPDFKGAIRVTKDRVEGVDVGDGAGMEYRETHFLAEGMVTKAYVRTLGRLTQKVNDATWRGWPAGEVFFGGADGNQRGRGDWEVSFSFRISENVDSPGITIGDVTGVIFKGHDYVWTFFEEDEDATAERIVQSPVAAYVEKVYRDGDFSNLGIGVS